MYRGLYLWSMDIKENEEPGEILEFGTLAESSLHRALPQNLGGKRIALEDWSIGSISSAAISKRPCVVDWPVQHTKPRRLNARD